MAETVPDWYVILVCGGLAAVLGLSVLLCSCSLIGKGVSVFSPYPCCHAHACNSNLEGMVGTGCSLSALAD